MFIKEDLFAHLIERNARLFRQNQANKNAEIVWSEFEKKLLAVDKSYEEQIKKNKDDKITLMKLRQKEKEARLKKMYELSTIELISRIWNSFC